MCTSNHNLQIKILKWKTAKSKTFFYFYYYHHDVKELRPFIIDVYGASWTKAQLKSFNKLKDWQVSPTLAAICKVVMDGANWEIETKAWADNKVIEILETGSKIADEVEKSEEVEKTEKTESVKKSEEVKNICKPINCIIC